MVSRDGDQRVLAALAAHGSDLTKPAHIIHFLYFKSLTSAQAAVAELQKAGYQTREVHKAPTQSIWKRIFGPHEYACVAETHAIPSPSAVFAATDRMNSLAQKLGGEYDGWEASIEK